MLLGAQEGHRTHVLSARQVQSLLSAVRLLCLEETEAQPEQTAEATAEEPATRHLPATVLRLSAAKGR